MDEEEGTRRDEIDVRLILSFLNTSPHPSPSSPTNTRIHFQIRKWASQYGEVIRIKLGPREIIVLNSVEAADELLGKRSGNYSNRAVPHVAHDILRDGLGITFMEYGPQWKVR